MKRALSIISQTILLVIAAVVFGIVLPGIHRSPFHMVHVIKQDSLLRRQYEFDWLIGVSLLYAMFLLIGLAARRIRTSWIGSTVALAITILIGLLLRLGFKDMPLS